MADKNDTKPAAAVPPPAVTLAPEHDTGRPRHIDATNAGPANLVAVRVAPGNIVFGHTEDGLAKRMYRAGEEAWVALESYLHLPSMGEMYDAEKNAWVQLQSPGGHPWKLTLDEKERVVQAAQRSALATAQRPEGSIAPPLPDLATAEGMAKLDSQAISKEG
jgi:hypothetical protein